MNVGGLSSTQLQEVQRLYEERCQSAATGRQTFTRPRRPDERHTLSVDYAGNDRYEIVSDRDGKPYYRYLTRGEGQYDLPVISKDGRTAWTQVKKWGAMAEYTSWISEIKLDAPRWLQYPRKLFTLERKLHDDVNFVGVSADDRRLLFWKDGEIVTRDRSPNPLSQVARAVRGRPGFETLATCDSPVEHVDVLSDGRLLAFPRNTWKQSCSIIEAGGAKVTEVPLRDLSRESFIEEVCKSSLFNGMTLEEVERFVDQAPPWLVGDRGEVACWQDARVYRPDGTGPERVIAARDASDMTAIFTWDGTTLSPRATLATSFDRMSPRMTWSRDGRQAVLIHRPDGARQDAVDIIEIDGPGLKLPRVDQAEVRDDALEIAWNGTRHRLELPLDVDGLSQEGGLVSMLEDELLGRSGRQSRRSSETPATGEPPRERPAGVVCGNDVVTIGGIPIPVRKSDPDGDSFAHPSAVGE